MGGGGVRLTLSGHDRLLPSPTLAGSGPRKAREKPHGGSPPPSWPSTTLLLPPQGQQLGVNGEDLIHCLLELPAALHPLACPLHPLFRDPLHPLAALEHESERPNRMPPPLGAMTGHLTATTVSLGQGTGKALGRKADTGQELAFSPP